MSDMEGNRATGQCDVEVHGNAGGIASSEEDQWRSHHRRKVESD